MALKETTEQRLEELKNKYSSVLRFIEQQQVRLQNLHIENNKLLIRAKAPSQDMKNRIWDQIKLVDPNYSDLTADIIVEAPAGETGGTTVDRAPAETYTVQPGDTLSKIAKQFYGNANDYMRIFEANRDKLSDPNKIFPGQELVIPRRG